MKCKETTYYYKRIALITEWFSFCTKQAAFHLLPSASRSSLHGHDTPSSSHTVHILGANKAWLYVLKSLLPSIRSPCETAFLCHRVRYLADHSMSPTYASEQCTRPESIRSSLPWQSSTSRTRGLQRNSACAICPARQTQSRRRRRTRTTRLSATAKPLQLSLRSRDMLRYVRRRGPGSGPRARHAVAPCRCAADSDDTPHRRLQRLSCTGARCTRSRAVD